MNEQKMKKLGNFIVIQKGTILEIRLPASKTDDLVWSKNMLSEKYAIEEFMKIKDTNDIAKYMEWRNPSDVFITPQKAKMPRGMNYV